MKRAFWVAGLLFALLSSVAQAQPRDAAAAEVLFRQGREAADQGDFGTACDKFKESNRLDPAVGTVFNIADCEERLGRLATAWTLFQEVTQRLAPSDERHAIATKRASALEPRLPRLTIKLSASAPPGIVIERDGVVLGAASLDNSLPVDPGPHEVVVRATGRSPGVFRVALREGEARAVEVTAGAPLESGGGGSHDQIPDRTEPGGNRTLGFVLGGLGIAGIAVGTVAGVMVLDRKSTADEQCPDKHCNEQGFDAVVSGRTLGVVSTTGFIVGGIGLAAGAYFILSSGSGEKPASTVSATFSPGGASFRFARSF
jgi:hypothetical protein